MATVGTIINCFHRLRVATNAHLNEEDVAIGLTEWEHALGDYDEQAVIDATDFLVEDDTFPTLGRMVETVERAQRVLRSEFEFAWGKGLHLVPDLDAEVAPDPVGTKRVIAMIREGLGATRGKTHEHSNGPAGCVICSAHDHSNGALYCEVCNPGTPYRRPDRRLEDEMHHCRYGCDPRSLLIEVYVDARNAEMPSGVMAATTAVKPCPEHNADAHDAWVKGAWGEQASQPKRRKGRATPVNDGG